MKKSFLILIALSLLATFSCKKKSSEEEPVPYATYKVRGVSTTLNYVYSFTKDLCSTSTYCGRFMVSGDTSKKETLKLGIPGDPIVGYVYYTGLYRFSCFYIDPNGTRYDLTGSDSSMFSVVFTQWDGQGGWGKGYFSGWMKSAANDSLLFQNGYFQNKIWTMVPK